MQGRARPSLAKLYNWRYEKLGDLPYVKTAPEFLRANPGFAHDFQFIDVPDYQGHGESAPVPYFFQVRLCRLFKRWTCRVERRDLSTQGAIVVEISCPWAML